MLGGAITITVFHGSGAPGTGVSVEEYRRGVSGTEGDFRRQGDTTLTLTRQSESVLEYRQTSREEVTYTKPSASESSYRRG